MKRTLSTDPTVVLFDFGGTLDADGVHWRDRFLALYGEEGLAAPEEEFRRAFFDADDHLHERFDLDNAGLEETVALQVGCVAAALAPRADDLAERVARRFVADSRATLERNRPLLERLRGRFRLGVVSNFYGNLERILTGEGLADLFDVIVDSGRLQVKKADPEIFLHATRSLGVAPERALFVGDSIPRDMRGAEGLDMPHAWLAGPLRVEEPPCCAEAPVLASLVDLEDVLAGVGAR